MEKKLKKFPPLRSDKEAEDFVDNADLSEYDFSEMVPVRFTFAKKHTAPALRIPQDLLDQLKAKADKLGVPHTRYVRMLIEQDLDKP